jgi:hypothetical protein
MEKDFKRALGDPHEFLRELPQHADHLAKYLKVDHLEMRHIRKAVLAHKPDITLLPEFMRFAMAGFAVVLINRYGQKLCIRGFFKKTIVVESKSLRCDFLDLFYRCVHEGLDFAEKGEGLPTKV